MSRRVQIMGRSADFCNAKYFDSLAFLLDFRNINHILRGLPSRSTCTFISKETSLIR